MALILESSSIKYLTQPKIDHKHSAYTTPSSSTSSLCGFDNSLKCQLPFYPDINWTNMFPLPLVGQIPYPAAPTQGVVSLLALPATTPLWPSDTTISFPFTCPIAEFLLRSDSPAKSSSFCFCLVWESWHKEK